MSGLPPLVLGSDEGRQLQNRIKSELAHRQWSEGDEDEVMAEYIFVMLANNKTSDQIASELEELVGDVGGEDSSPAAIKAFVDWLWEERARIGKEGDHKMDTQSATTSSEAKSREQWRANETKRRSLSPPRRAAAPHQSANENDRRESDRWGEDRRREQGYNRSSGDQRNRRELFPSDRRGNGRYSSDATSTNRNGNRELLNGTNNGSYQGQAAMDDPSLQEQSNQVSSLKILGQGSNTLFQKNLQQSDHSSESNAPTKSIFSRMSVPDPRAQEFTPSSSNSQSQDPNANLLYRIDPMVPFNQIPINNEIKEYNSSFPSQPIDAALCRYSLRCTNPMCGFSHPSASAISQSKKTGQEPLVLKKEACRFQKDCTNVECSFSHTSPAIRFHFEKLDKVGFTGDTIAKTGPIACHFQMECKNPACTFAHYDPKTGQIVSTPALSQQGNTNEASNKLDQALTSEIKSCRFGVDCTRKDCHFSHPPERQSHISDRLARFNSDQVDGEMEVIIPAM